MLKILKHSVYWTGFLVFYASIVLAVGTFLGAVAFSLLGQLGTDLSLQELFQKGAWAGFRYAGVWALGLSIILCFMRGKRKYFTNASKT